MNRCGICFSTKDRVELSRRSIEPLLQPFKFDLFIVDGSDTGEGRSWADTQSVNCVSDIRGGADAAIVHNLTYLLDQGYEYIGLVENDVLMTSPDWFERTMELFEAGESDGLAVGAVSARCYADRMLVQRDGYALMHNLGAGMVIFSQHAARLVLDHFRTTWTMENRTVFAQLAGTDIGRYWAFKGGEHWLCADWGIDKTLAAHGYASLALVPSPVEMIGQDLVAQGLEIVRRHIDEFCLEPVFAEFVGKTDWIRRGLLCLPDYHRHHDQQGELIFAHSLRNYSGAWTFQWFQGFGPFAWCALDDTAQLSVGILGPCNILIRGGSKGGRFKITDTYSDYEATPLLQPDIMMAAYVPGAVQFRRILIQALDPGMLFHGIQCVQPQPRSLDSPFNWHHLPKVSP